jgi:5-methylthioribose kinase
MWVSGTQEKEPMSSVGDFLDSSVIRTWLASKPEYLERVGEIESLDEVGDGNLNFVWIIRGTKGALVAKKVCTESLTDLMTQAPPFVRILPDWSLKTERAWYEYQLLLVENKWAPGLVPEVYGYDEETKTVVMEFLTPHIILRKGLIGALGL